MKRRVRTLLVLLLLGALINIAVAWGLCMTRGIGQQRSGLDPSQTAYDYWDAYRPPLFADRPDSGFEACHLGFVHAMLVVVNAPGAPAYRQTAAFQVAGLPTPSLIGYRFERFVAPPGNWQVDANTLLQVRDYDSTTRTLPTRLPLRPLWPGFAINMLFYAAILWLLLAAPFALRRWRRTRRGLCPQCAYPVGASAVCTECGMPFPPPWRAGVGGG